MEKKLNALLVELNKVVFEFGDFEAYNAEMREELEDEWINSEDVDSIMWFFENMFLDEVDFAIMENFKANIKVDKFHKVMVHYDEIMKHVLKLGKEYN